MTIIYMVRAEVGIVDGTHELGRNVGRSIAFRGSYMMGCPKSWDYTRCRGPSNVALYDGFRGTLKISESYDALVATLSSQL